MRTVITLIGAVAVVVAAAFAALYSGVYDVAATSPDNAVVKWWMHETMEYSVKRRAEGIQVPALGRPDQIKMGFDHYDEDCSHCHTPPGARRTDVNKGLNPEPPDLAEEAEELSAAEIFWITKHGIKMTGMPAWGPTHSDRKIWSLVSFVKQLPHMTAAEYRAMKNEGEAHGDAGDGSREQGDRQQRSAPPGKAK